MELGADLTGYQIGKLKHAFGLDYSNKPYRNYYYCSENNNEWDDMCRKGYAIKKVNSDYEIVYSGTLKGLRTVFRKNITRKYFESI
ncbi:hypothetical protein [Bacillus swezeyi]|uniref:Uncharacterized protein n=1 Tax=Bacillus swezeyi TaxID=1925020 RepID=A0A5M8RH72_9BACI|nr:hypothetical protein [Bacillus swezeyi]KAA6447569.1 hypothetical protein DX927_20040 [Bacillus swezeyi]TYS34150.1 hypothetical protein FZC77_17045 [Bacillus swezeyi]